MAEQEQWEARVSELGDIYLFFKQRWAVEQAYADSLAKLAASYGEEAANAPSRASHQRPSFKSAYLELRSSVMQQASTHRTFATSLGQLVGILTQLRDEKDKMNRRIKEDWRSIKGEHEQYKLKVGKLQQRYERKVDEAQDDIPPASGLERSSTDSRRGDNAPLTASQLHRLRTKSRSRSRSRERKGPPGAVSMPPPPAAGFVPSGPLSPPISASLPSSAPASPGPPPIGPPKTFISGATTGAPLSSYRDAPVLPGQGGKSGNVFEALKSHDWAAEKVKVSGLVQRAIGGGNKGESEGSGGAGPPGAPGAGAGPAPGATGNALKSSASLKTRGHRSGSNALENVLMRKREAEQADREYRTGIFHLETLRLQKERVSRSSKVSLGEAVSEIASTMKEVMRLHAAQLLQVAQHEQLIGEHCQTLCDTIDPENDVREILTAGVDAGRPSSPQVFYQNRYVGECRTLLFGVGLMDYVAQNGNTDRLVPLIVEKCIAEIDGRGLKVEGIYRVSGKMATVQQVAHAIEKDEAGFQFDAKREDPATVCSVLKLYLRQLPTPLMPFPVADRIAFSQGMATDPQGSINSLSRRIRRLSRPGQATLRALMEHLARVVEHQAYNKMTPLNLTVCCGPAVFGDEDGNPLELHSAKDTVIETLILNHGVLFDGIPIDPPPVRSRQGSHSLGHAVGQSSGNGSESLAPPGPPPPLPPRGAGDASAPTIPRSGSEDVYAAYQNLSNHLSEQDAQQQQQQLEHEPALPPPPPPIETSLPSFDAHEVNSRRTSSTGSIAPPGAAGSEKAWKQLPPGSANSPVITGWEMQTDSPTEAWSTSDNGAAVRRMPSS